MGPDFAIYWPSLRGYLGWIAGQRPTAIAMNMNAELGAFLMAIKAAEAFGEVVKFG